jgi:hypothetical protein
MMGGKSPPVSSRRLIVLDSTRRKEGRKGEGERERERRREGEGRKEREQVVLAVPTIFIMCCIIYEVLRQGAMAAYLLKSNSTLAAWDEVVSPRYVSFHIKSYHIIMK